MTGIHNDLTEAHASVTDPLDHRVAEFNERIYGKFGTPTELEAVPPIGGDASTPAPNTWEAFKQAMRQPHEHSFTYQLNANHTALRGCACGLAFASLVMGQPESLVWHQIYEFPAEGE